VRPERLIAVLLTIAVALADATFALAQGSPAPPTPTTESAEAGSPVYKPPLRGAPGGRVGGASRSAVRISTPLPVIEQLAPADHAGLTATATPTLYFYVSRPVAWPIQFTISAPMQPAPVLEVTIPSPAQAGIYALRPGDYRIHMSPGLTYTWSVSIVLDPRAWSRNIVASSTIVFDPTLSTSAALAVPPLRRAALLADAGLWYDAVAAAAEAQSLDRHAALDALIHQAGLSQAAGYAQDLPGLGSHARR
jgi:Domain of Unknown Function (DUF928)